MPDPVLDVGCGPGRIVAALAAEGRIALGVDPSPAAIAEAARRAPRAAPSVFDPLPGERRWGTVLLLDGNVGIGGDPVALLARAAWLLRPGGVVVAEVDPPGRPGARPCGSSRGRGRPVVPVGAGRAPTASPTWRPPPGLAAPGGTRLERRRGGPAAGSPGRSGR